MSKITGILIGLLFVMSTAFAEGFYDQPKYFEARLGAMFPWSTAAGFRGGALLGMHIDQVVSINTYVDYFGTTYTTEEVGTNKDIQSSKISSEVGANLLIWMLNCRIEYPTLIMDVLSPYAQLGVGYEIMINNYNNAQTSSLYFFGNFGIQLELGTHIKLGDKSYLIVSGNYNFCSVSRGKDSNDKLFVGEKIDVGGFGVFGGIGFQI
jgi:hypothetical protein